jgi:HD-GYP domain-containing protein (c-di-GMP phosphodiesterase class II)
LPLPLRMPEAGEQSRQWVCTGCGKSYWGVLLHTWPLEFRRNVQPAVREVEQPAPPSPSEAAADSSAPLDDAVPHPISRAFPGRQAAPSNFETVLSRKLDAEIDLAEDFQLKPQGTPFAERLQRHGGQPYNAPVMKRFAQLIQRSAEQLRKLFAALNAGQPVRLDVVKSISQDGLFRVAEDKDLFVNLGIAPSRGGYPSRHSLGVGILAMAVGTTLGWDEDTLLDLGTGCLVHDLGMLGIRRAPHNDKRILLPSELAEIAKHPVLTFELLQRHLDLIPPSARMVAYQMHERCNGSGYPRGYGPDRIHYLAKIAAVADVFVALISPRPHRPGSMPYHALKQILLDTKNGLFDPDVVRALLQTVSLFPIGSYVRLNDGRAGKVIRASDQLYDRPIVEVVKSGDPSHALGVVDLASQDEVRITGALARPDY